jgi:Na+/H+ antiporter NhaD/arsenite permease-like protein
VRFRAAQRTGEGAETPPEQYGGGGDDPFARRRELEALAATIQRLGLACNPPGTLEPGDELRRCRGRCRSPAGKRRHGGSPRRDRPERLVLARRERGLEPAEGSLDPARDEKRRHGQRLRGVGVLPARLGRSHDLDNLTITMLAGTLWFAAPAALAVAARPRSMTAAAFALTAGGCALVLAHAPVRVAAAAAASTAELALFLGATVWLASFTAGSGLADRAADGLARLGGGRTIALYAAACAGSALLTCMVSLDGAVLVAAPVLRRLARRHGAPGLPLALGTVATANSSSLGLLQGSPTNVLVTGYLGVGAWAFGRAMAIPALAASQAGAVAVAVGCRKALAAGYTPRASEAGRSARTRGQAPALAALLGLDAGAFATSHASVATIIGLEALEPQARAPAPWRHVRLCARPSRS